MGYIEMSPGLAKAITLAKYVRTYEEMTAKATKHAPKRKAVILPPKPRTLPTCLPRELAVELTPGWLVAPEMGGDNVLVQQQIPNRIRIIIWASCQWFGCLRADLMTKRRDIETVHRRYVAMYLCKVLTAESYPGVGRRFGGYDHTTIIHAVSRIEDMISGRYLLDRLAHYEGGARKTRIPDNVFKDDVERVRRAIADVEAIRELVRATAGF